MKKKIFSITLSILFILSSFTPALASEETTPSGIPLSKLEEKIDEHVNKYIEKASPGAAVGVVKDGKIIFSKGYGYEDVDKKTPINPKTTVFEYCSVGKLFVWTSVMQLVEEGKIDLNKDIKTYLPKDFSSKLKYKKPITMLNLMQHKAGFQDYNFDFSVSKPELTIDLEEALLKYQPKQIYDPGTIPAYSNYGASLAGYIVETITGEKFSTYEEKNIFSKSNMKSTFSNPTVEDTEKLKTIKATGYTPDLLPILIKGEIVGEYTKQDWMNISLYPAGSVNGTLEDLANFAIALTPKNKENSPLFKNRATLDKMLSPSSTYKDRVMNITHGFLEYNGESYTVGHSGESLGFSSQIGIVPSESFGVVVLTNSGVGAQITAGILDLLTMRKNATLTTTVVPGKDLPSSKEVEGSYVISRRDSSHFNKLFSHIAAPIKIKSLSENEIELSTLGSKVSFVQVKPGIYQLVETPSTGTDIKQLMSAIYFDLKDGKVNYMSQSAGANYIPVPKGETASFVTFSIGIIIISLVYFIIALIALLIQKLINKKKKREFSKENKLYKRIYVALNISGAVTVINNMMLVSNYFKYTLNPPSSLGVHIIFNWVLLFVNAVLIVLLLLKYKNAKLSRKQKVFGAITIIILVLFTLILVNWNFFNLIN